MKILMISSTFPYPPTKGGTQNRTFNLLKYIAQNHQVTLITQVAKTVTEIDIKNLREYVHDLQVFLPNQPVTNYPWSKINRLIKAWYQGIPPHVKSLYNPHIQDWLDQAIFQQKFELITCEHSVNEIYIRPEWKQQLKTLINIHSSVFKTCQNGLVTKTSEYPWRDRLYLPLLRRYEQQILTKFSQIIVTTDEDAEQMSLFAPTTPITIVPNGVDLSLFPYRNRDPGGYNLIFVGGLDYLVNIDAVCFFAREILPLLQQDFPATSLTIVGANPTPEVIALTQQSPGITVTGRVPSVVEYLHQATVAIAPLRSGFGMKIKTLEYMAAGTPVVGSDRGLEGLKVEQPLLALRANTISEYVTSINKLFTDEQLRATLSVNARRMIEADYTWESLAAQYQRILDL